MKKISIIPDKIRSNLTRGLIFAECMMAGTVPVYAAPPDINLNNAATKLMQGFFGVCFIVGAVDIVIGAKSFYQASQDDDQAAMKKGKGHIIGGIILVAASGVIQAVTGQNLSNISFFG